MFPHCVTSRAMVESLFGHSDAFFHEASHPESKDNFGNQILCTLAEKHIGPVYVFYNFLKCTDDGWPVTVAKRITSLLCSFFGAMANTSKISSSKSSVNTFVLLARCLLTVCENHTQLVVFIGNPTNQ